MNPIVRGFFRFYSWVLSPAVHTLAGPGAGCRFNPTCSHFAEKSIQKFGIWTGLGLAVRRVVQCHPWSRVK